MNFKNVGMVAQRFGKATMKTLEHYAPKILVGLGIACFGGATIAACKATTKLAPTMEEINHDISVAKAIEANDADAEKQKNKELTKAYISGGVKLAKLYGAAIALTASGAACVLSGNHIMTKRYAGAIAALTSTENMYNTYRQRVIEECGEEKDVQFQNGIKEVVDSVPVLNKDGSPKVDKNGEVKTVEKRSFQQTKSANIYSRMFEEATTRAWDPSPEYNRSSLKLKENFFNQQLHSWGYITLNEVYRQLGFPTTSYGQDVGWVIDDETPHAVVDLGLYDVDPEQGCMKIDALDAFTNSILLTFNGCRYIKDKIFKYQRIF